MNNENVIDMAQATLKKAKNKDEQEAIEKAIAEGNYTVTLNVDTSLKDDKIFRRKLLLAFLAFGPFLVGLGSSAMDLVASKNELEAEANRYRR